MMNQDEAKAARAVAMETPPDKKRYDSSRSDQVLLRTVSHLTKFVQQTTILQGLQQPNQVNEQTKIQPQLFDTAPWTRQMLQTFSDLL